MARSSDPARERTREDTQDRAVRRPGDHIDGDGDDRPVGLGIVGSLRFAWRQLTSMRTALFLLLLLAIAAVPGSLVPQRSSDPNGVTQYRTDHPDLYPIVEALQGFDVYTSVWFSAIYLLLFVSLIGCVVPRIAHHWRAMRSRPPRTPARLERLDHVETREWTGDTETAVAAAERVLRARRYRVERYGDSISAERGYLRETGNLVFHGALVGILLAVAAGGSLGYNGQKVVVEGESFVNYIGGYDSFTRGRLVTDDSLVPYRLQLDRLAVEYERENANAVGAPLDYEASLTVTEPGEETSEPGAIRVNEPLRQDGTDVYLLGNGYAPRITVRDADGDAVFSGAIPFLPQDPFLTSVGIVKVPDGLAEQIGMVGFFYPTPTQLETGAFASSFPDLSDPLLSFNVYSGDLGLDEGVPRSVYALDTDDLTPIAGRDAASPGLELREGETAALPGGLGTVTFDGVSRFASLEIHHDPARTWVLVFAILVLAGLLTSLFIPRRRMWIKAVPGRSGSVTLQYAGLARSDDPRLGEAVHDLAEAHAAELERLDPAGNGLG